MKNLLRSVIFVMTVTMAWQCSRADSSTQVEEKAEDTDTVSVNLTQTHVAPYTKAADVTETGPETAVADTDAASSVTPALSIAMVGDIMMGTTFPDDTPRLPANGGRNLFDDVKPVLAGADIVCGNLEGVLMEPGGTPRKMGRDPKTYYIFRMPPEYVGNLVDAGFDFVSIANNHANDMQDAGRKSTKRVLSGAGIAYAGQTDCPTAMIEHEGRKIGFAAFGHSANTCHTWKYDNVRHTVARLDSVCDIVVVSFHGGAEGADCGHVPFDMEKYVGEDRGDVAKFAHAAVDAGADVVYGHGPHVTRAVELYKDRLIVYSLGNFCTPARVSITGVKGHAPVVSVDVDSEGRFAGGKIHSFIQQYGKGPRTDALGKVAAHMRRLSEQDFPSSPLRIADDGTIARQGEPMR